MSKVHHYDLVVVGGGPAESSAVYVAAKNGIKAHNKKKWKRELGTLFIIGTKGTK